MASYSYTHWEKIRLAAPCARQRLKPRKHLIAGPYAGEFGPELMQWQSYVRARRRFYEQTHVISFPGRAYLYEGCTVHEHAIEPRDAGYWYGRLAPREMLSLAQKKAAELGLEDYDVFTPALLCSRYHKWLFWGQEWRVFEEPYPSEQRSDVVCHFRALTKTGADVAPKSYTAERADELVRCLTDRGWRVACIGHPSYSYAPPGALDLRSVELRDSIRALSAGKCFLGGMSGPVHLACLAGKPVLTWGGDNAPAYALRWNPFAVPLECVSTSDWQPEPKVVAEQTARFFEAWRTRSQDFQKPLYSWPPQAIARA